MMSRWRSLAALAVLVAACASPPATPGPTLASPAPDAVTLAARPLPGPTAPARPASRRAAPVVVMAAGDIQSGRWSPRATFEMTARVLDANPHDFVLGLGDLSNEHGTAWDYAQLDKAWGRHKAKLLAVPGSHDANAGDSFYDYFNGKGRNDGLPAPGAHAGPRGKGYFATSLGAWLLIGLNYCATPSQRFATGDAQMRWLAEVMKAKPKGKPVIVINHTPRYTHASNHHENEQNESLAWEILLRFKPDVRLFLCAHMNGIYERWVPMDNARRADAAGIRSFTVGTGGQSPYRMGKTDRLLQKTAAVFGVLQLTLRPDGYDWDFKAIAGSKLEDSGADRF